MKINFTNKLLNNNAVCVFMCNYQFLDNSVFPSNFTKTINLSYFYRWALLKWKSYKMITNCKISDLFYMPSIAF
ncbi:hypothetical protein CRENPOLYSF2_3050004 [Crenothrix polyspora]|uniref:Uncharacterized protein n=1 Tax=Crenothrix polyspora TaxID=360316 RepID=A0A1R4H9Z5_9GAMM|nr:hypothetical protein CRENPOLYSF2_3050004 [Crenothrix polyspora]